MKKAIFLYDFTGIMAQPWLEAGYECWCFDGQHPEGVHKNGLHVTVGMWLFPHSAQDIKRLVGDGVEFVFGFPECTHLAVSGARHFARKLAENPNIQVYATELAKLVERVGQLYSCPWGAENPVSVLSSLWRKPDWSFHPWEYGGYLPDDDVNPMYPEYVPPRDAYPKKTCVWCGNGFTIPAKLPVDVPKGVSSPQYRKLGGKSIKTKNIRSATPRGFAKAVFLANSKL